MAKGKAPSKDGLTRITTAWGEYDVNEIERNDLDVQGLILGYPDQDAKAKEKADKADAKAAEVGKTASPATNPTEQDKEPAA